jgi:hypothetical protein
MRFTRISSTIALDLGERSFCRLRCELDRTFSPAATDSTVRRLVPHEHIPSASRYGLNATRGALKLALGARFGPSKLDAFFAKDDEAAMDLLIPGVPACLYTSQKPAA